MTFQVYIIILYFYDYKVNRSTKSVIISDCRYRVIESSSLVPVLFREVFSHPYISLFHLLVNVFSVTCFRTVF